MEQTYSSRVFLISASKRSEGIKRLLEEFDIGSGGSIALKANYNSDDPFPATTHIDTLRSLVEGLKAAGSFKITMAERSGMGVTGEVLKNRGVFDLSDSFGFEVIDLDLVGAKDWLEIPPKGLHWKHGFKIFRIFAEADAVVQTCCLKTHRFGGHFTMSLKNSVGLVAARPEGSLYDFMRELHTSTFQRLMIAEINGFYRTDLVLMDAASGFVRGGPEKGNLVSPNLLIASNDRVAVDAVGVALLRHYGSTPEVMSGRIFDQEQISRAAALGVGVNSAGKIELEPLDDESRIACETIRNVLDTQG
jgi:uncharacterized protein (DUF362 family)